MWCRVFAGIAVAVGVATTPALACNGKYILYRDDFRTVDPAWDHHAWFSIGGGQAKITPDQGKALSVILNGVVFDQADMCADLAMASPGDPNKPYAGIIFWLQDYGNFYGLFISPAGTASVQRVQDRKWSQIVGWRKLNNLQTNPGAVATLRVTINGTAAATYVNNQPFANITGQAPDGGGAVGFHAESEQNHADSWVYTNLKITNPP